MSNNRFRVTVNGFYVRAQTWDDVFNWDGFADEVYFVGSVRSINSDRSDGPSSDITSAVMGDTSAQAPTVKAGTAKATGGLQTGDSFPTSEPWKKGRLDNLSQGYPPFALWEGDIPPGGRSVFIALAIYEWDPGASPLQSILQWLDKATTKFKDRIGDFLGPMGKKVYEGVELGLDILGSMDDGGIFGSSGSKPIGIQRSNYEANKGVFTPKVIVLNYDNAIQIVNDAVGGRGHGSLELNYVNDSYYRGDYAIYLQIEYLIDDGSG